MISHKIYLNNYNNLNHKLILCIYENATLIDILYVYYEYKAYRFRYECSDHFAHQVLNYMFENNLATVYKKIYQTEYYKGCPAIYKLKLTDRCLLSAL